MSGERQDEMRDPTEEDLKDTIFNAVFQAVKGWDVERTPGEGLAGANGTDVMTILNVTRSAVPKFDLEAAAAAEHESWSG